MISMVCGNPAACQAIEFIILFKYALYKMKLVARVRRAGAKKTGNFSWVITQHNQFTAGLSRFGPAGTPLRFSYHQGVAQYKHNLAFP
jgi:hypothetical protein